MKKNAFPLLSKHPDLVYLDNAATTQKPQVVIDALSDYYIHKNSNLGRSVYDLAKTTTKLYYESKKIIADFFGAHSEELIFTQNCTDSINSVVQAWANQSIKQDDIILLPITEHHSNIVVWQQLAEKKGCEIIYLKVNDYGQIDLQFLQKKITNKVKLVALNHISNVTGVVNPICEISKTIKKYNKKNHTHIKVLVDGAQAPAHTRVDFKDLGVDFYTFSSHKMYGPMGLGGLLVKKQLLQKQIFKPWIFGGGMIEQVTIKQATFNVNLQQRYMAGTPNVAAVFGLAQACQFIKQIGRDKLQNHSQKLVCYAYQKLSKIKDIRLIGPPFDRLAVLSFGYKTYSPHDIAQVLNKHHIAVRSGFHCCQPLHQYFGWTQGSVRLSVAIYNDYQDLDQLIEVMKTIDEYLV